MTDVATNPDEAFTGPVTKEWPRQREWIGEVLGKTLQEEATQGRASEMRRDLKIEIDNELRGLRGDIKKGQSYDVDMVPQNVWQWAKDKVGLLTMSSMSGSEDAMKEIDTHHDMPNMKALPPEVVKKVMESIKKVADLSKKMRESKVDGVYIYGGPEPSEAEVREMREKGTYEKFMEQKKMGEKRLSDDLWQPLYREGIIPENAIPQKYSELARTVAGANEFYDKRLKEHTENMSKADKLMEKLHVDAGFNVAGDLLKAGSSFTSMAGNAVAASEGAKDVKDSALGADLVAAAKIVETTRVCLQSTREIGTKIVQNRDFIGSVDSFNVALKAVLTTATGDKDTANLVYLTINAACRSAGFADKLKDGKVDEAFQQVGLAIESGLGAVGSKGGLDNNAVAYAGQAINAVISKAAQAPSVAKAIKNGNYYEALDTVAKDLVGNVQTVSKDILGEMKAQELKELEKKGLKGDELKDAQAKIDTEYTKKSDGIDTGAGGLTAASGLGADILDANKLKQELKDKFNLDALEKLEEDAAEEQDRQLAAFMQEPDEALEAELAFGFAEAGDESEVGAQDHMKEMHTIEMLIIRQKKHDMAFQMAYQITNGAMGVVAGFVPGAGIGVAAVQLIYALAEAVKHTRRLLIWMANVDDAKKTKSAQYDAMLNRYGLEQKQNLEADIVVALKAIKLAGEIVKVAGQAAPAGVAISAAADGAEACMSAASTVMEEVAMASAWSKYKKMLADPEDRKNMRDALRANPTLSKYAMAYGACIEKNPTAMKGMKRCGIDAKSLANAGAKCDLVVEYLETVYKDDPVLLRAVPNGEKWHPGPVQVTVKSWQAFYLAATTDAEPPLQETDVSGVTAALARLITCEKKFREACKAADKEIAKTGEDAKPADQLAACEQVATRFSDYDKAYGVLVRKALQGFTPLAEEGGLHKQMDLYKDALEAQVILQWRDVTEAHEGYAVRRAGFRIRIEQEKQKAKQQEEDEKKKKKEETAKSD